MPLPENEIKAIQEAIEELTSSVVGSGRKRRNLSEMFMDLVDREAWAEYYNVIKEPRCINGVSEKLAQNGYKSALDVWEDLQLVFTNAMHFNEAGSQIHKDAEALKEKLTKAWSDRPILPVLCSHDIVLDDEPIPELLLRRKTSKDLDTVQTKPTTGAPTPSSSSVPPTTAVPEVRRSAVESIQNPAETIAQLQPVPTQARSPARPSSPDMDIDVGGTPEPEGGVDDTARDEEGEAIVQQLERGLPRWQGLGDQGWQLSVPSERWLELVLAIKGHKDAVGNRLAPALENIPENAAIPHLSFNHPLSLKIMENRARSKSFASNKDFDHEMMRLFEKGRRWHEQGSEAYGRILLLQRLYQALTSPNPPAGPPYVSLTNFASLRAGPAARLDERQPAVTSFRVSAKDRTFVDEVHYKGWSFRQADWVHVCNPDDPSKPIMGQIFKCYISDEPSRKGQPGITVCWYYRPEQTVHPAHRQFWENEVFKTSHFADHPLDDVIEKVAVQFTARHIRGRPRPPFWYLGWPLYVCDSRYNDRERVFVKIKNWNSCVPEEVRKSTEFMPIYPFERMVYPRRFDSPFLHGKVRGPGGIGEPVDRADGERTEGGGTGRKRSKKPGAITDVTGPTKGLYVGVPGASGATAAGTSASASMTMSGTAALTRAQSMQATAYQQIHERSGLPKVSTVVPQTKTVEDRSIITAAGGQAVLGANAVVEKLPPATTKHFDRDAETNEVLWFAAPPVDIARGQRAQYSLRYLHWLATRKRKADDGGRDDGMEIDKEAERSKRAREAEGRTATERVTGILDELGL